MTNEPGPYGAPENPPEHVQSTGDPEDTRPFYPPPPPAQAAPPAPPAARGTPGVVRATMAAGLVAAGLVVGGGIGFVAGHATGSGADTSRTAFQAPNGGFGPQSGNGQGMPQGGVGGGMAGEQHLQGTLTAVGSSTVTVRTSSGTATYQVTGSTQILRDGQPATLSELRTGEQVLVHVYPASGGRLVVERIFAGTLPSFGDGRGDDNGGSASGSTT